MSMVDFVIWLVVGYVLAVVLAVCTGFVIRLFKPSVRQERIDEGMYLPPKIMVERVGGGFDKPLKQIDR